MNDYPWYGLADGASTSMSIRPECVLIFCRCVSSSAGVMLRK